MLQENKISITLKPEDMQKVLEALNVVNEVLKPHMIALTPAERQEIPKMSDRTLPFVQKSLEYAQTNPNFVPIYVNVGELKIDFEAVEALLKIFRPVEQLYFNLNDTMTLCGSEAYVASLSFYNSVKQATKLSIPGAKAISEDLKMRFSGQGKRTGKSEDASSSPLPNGKHS